MGESANNQERPSAGKAPATDSWPAEAKVAEPRKQSIIITGEPPNIEEQDPPLAAAEDATGQDDEDFDNADVFSAASATVRSSIWEHEYESGRRVRYGGFWLELEE